MIKNQNGNVFVYILIAVVLLGALMFTLSKTSNQNDAVGELSDGQNKIVAGEIIAYAASASNALTQMQQTGATVDQIDFELPSDSNFNTAPTIYKFFHPDGGGFNHKPLPAKAVADDAAGLEAGYYVGFFNSFEWTPSVASDVVFTAYEITEGVCTELNRKIDGSSTIPSVNGGQLEEFLVDDSLYAGSNAPFNISNCAGCEDKPSLCVTNGSGKYAFYSLLEAQ
jgi:hypothetical protein